MKTYFVKLEAIPLLFTNRISSMLEEIFKNGWNGEKTEHIESYTSDDEIRANEYTLVKIPTYIYKNYFKQNW